MRRRDIADDPRSFNRQCAGTGHRIDEAADRGRQRGPFAAHQHGRGQIFLQRRRIAGFAIAAPVKAFAGQVNGNLNLAAGHEDVDAQIRSSDDHRRPQIICWR